MRCQTQSQSTAHCMKVRADRLPLQLISLVLNEYNRHENMAAPYVNKLGVLKKLNAHWLGPKKRIYAHTPTRTTHMHIHQHAQHKKKEHCQGDVRTS